MKIITINEDKFNIEIDEWNDFTVGLFKLYSDWRCNGQSNKLEAHEEINVNNNVKSDKELIEDLDTLIRKNGLKEKAEKDIKIFCGKKKIKKTQGQRPDIFTDDDVFESHNKYNITIYKPIIEYIMQRLPEPPRIFNIYDIQLIIGLFYNEKNIKITQSTEYGYANSYRNCMINHNMIKRLNHKDHVKIIAEEINNFTEKSSNKTASDNIILFKNWVEKYKIKEFTLDEFLKYDRWIGKEAAEKFIAYLISKNMLFQIGNDKFQVNFNNIQPLKEV